MIDVEKNLNEIKTTLPTGVTLVAVSKFHPIEALMQAYNAGQRVFGESRVQELSIKYQQMPSDVQWHFIGHLQTNKVRMVIPCVSLIHSIDSIKLLSVVNQESEKIGKTTDVLLQLHVAKEETKFGFTIEECIENAKAGVFAGFKNVRICGVMGMATNTDDVAEIETEFDAIRNAFDELKHRFFLEDSLFCIKSMGMSDDYPLAIEKGSNMVRIGSSIFGMREY